MRLPAQRLGSRLSLVHPGPVSYSDCARGEGAPSGRGEELQRVVGPLSAWAGTPDSVCYAGLDSDEGPKCLLPMLLTYARQSRSHSSSVREARIVLGEEGRSPSRRPCPPKRAASPADRTARARSTGARRAREHVAEGAFRRAFARAAERRRSRSRRSHVHAGARAPRLVPGLS